jgi:hypothetical protein
MKFIAALAMVLGLGATPVLAAGNSPSNEPSKLSDSELDQVTAGDPLIYVGILAPINVHIEPITVNVPINVAAIVQANVLGNGVFDALAVGTQNVYQAASGLSAAGLKPGG